MNMNYSQNITELIGNKTTEEVTRVVADNIILPNMAIFYLTFSMLFLIIGMLIAPRSKGKVFTIWIVSTILSSILFVIILIYPQGIPSFWTRLF